MIIKCAWCQRRMGEKEPFGDKRITHGICDACKKKVLKESKKINFIRCPNCDTIILEDTKC